MNQHAAQIEQMLEEVESWEGRKIVSNREKAETMLKHGVVFREMLMEVLRWQGMAEEEGTAVAECVPSLTSTVAM